VDSGQLFSSGWASGRFFGHGFAKNERDNIRDDERAAFKKLATEGWPWTTRPWPRL